MHAYCFRFTIIFTDYPNVLLIIRLFTVLMNEFNFALSYVTFEYFLLPISLRTIPKLPN